MCVCLFVWLETKSSPFSRPPPAQIIFIETNYVCRISMSSKTQLGNSA
jgi:hypothetical protein